MMAHDSQKKVCVERDSMFARLSELCPSPISFFNSRGTSGTISSPSTANSTHGKRLCDAVYAFHEPQEQVDVEIVFIHGLEFDGSKEAYWKTWLAKDGTQDNCWPETWLVEKFPCARILSLSYDANVVQTSTSGRMDPYSLGESLLQEMTLVGIGQHECPVVFVCHSFGGLVAKQIVVMASQNLPRDKEVQNLLRNLQAFYFYATPHAGVEVDFSPLIPFVVKGSCMSYLEVFCPEVGRLNSNFEQIHREVYNNEWMCYNVGEMHATSHGRVVVPESSARHVGGRFLALSASHFDICKPRSKEDSGYLFLIDCISKVIKYNNDKQRRLLDLPNGLVGVDDMHNTICGKLGTFSIIGLVGMGGIGKTTISKCVYNSQAKFYDKTCFLQDVRSRGVASVQKELLKEICDVSLDSGDHVSPNHLRIIQHCIMERRVLIVIDDVGDSETLKGLQVPAFQRKRDRSNGSRVIVTCRNRQVLENHVGLEGLKDVEIMEVQFLNDAQSMKLFEYHVFHGLDEMQDFQDLAMAIAKACCGLPLSLEVIGQHLRKQHVHSIGTRKEIWKEALRKLRDAESFDGGNENEVLWKRLKISYDDLSNDTKNMFLDFACFFCEISSEDLSAQSIGLIWNSPIGLQNLLARSLIKVGVVKLCFTIHDQLRDMGRRIVKDLSLKGLHVSLMNMSRLWEADQIESFLEGNQSSSVIEGISLRNPWQLAAFDSQTYPRLLRKLTMECFDKLRISLPNCWRFSTLQSQEMTTQRLELLRLLHLVNCKMKIVEFFLRKCWKELSWLCLDWIHGMVKPHVIEAIGFCTRLRVLQMRGCNDMKELPVSIGNLVHLLELDLSWCFKLRSLPLEIGHLKRLKRLQLHGCKELEEVPSVVSQLSSLEYIGLSRCFILKSIVEFELQMDHLYELDLSYCGGLRIPFKSLGKLYQLRTLNMYECSSFIERPLESFRQLSRLEKLNIEHFNVTGYNIPTLRFDLDRSTWEVARVEFERSWDQIIESFSFCLQELRLPTISQAGFPTYSKLKVLSVENRFHLEELPASLGNLTQLKRLTVVDKYPYFLKKLSDSLLSLVKLEVLKLVCVNALEKLPDQLGHLSSLKYLQIFKTRKMEELPSSLGQLLQLEYLSLRDCKSLKRLPESSRSLTQLSRLDLSGCNKFEVTDVGQKILLQELEQCGCRIDLPTIF